MWLLNFRAWEAARIDYQSIFDFNSDQESSYQDVIATSLMLALMWTTSLIFFIFADFFNISPFYFPLLLMAFYLVFLFNPVKIFKYRERMWILRITMRVILAPIPFVTFADLWESCLINLKNFIKLIYHFTVWRSIQFFGPSLKRFLPFCVFLRIQRQNCP